MSRFIIIALITFYSLLALAGTNLTGITHTNLAYNEYKVTFTTNNQVMFKVTPLPEKNKIIIDFTDSKFAVKSLPKNKLNHHFIKNLHKSVKNSKDLRITLELAKNTKLYKSYAIVKNGQLFTTIELKNDRLKPKTPEVPVAKKFVIMIDPGHGGSDSGTIGLNPNILEKDIALAYAKELAQELAKYPHYEVIMTRDSDKNASLNERKEKAHNTKADIFISLHADSNPNNNLQGASVYTLSQEALDEESLALSERENKSAILKNDQLLQQNQEIANVLINMVYHETKNSSVQLAEATAKELGKEIKMMHKLHRSAGFKVLKGVDIPAILIEIGYLSNAEEEKLLTSYMHKKIFARAVAQGVTLYEEQINKKKN